MAWIALHRPVAHIILYFTIDLPLPRSQSPPTKSEGESAFIGPSAVDCLLLYAAALHEASLHILSSFPK